MAAGRAVGVTTSSTNNTNNNISTARKTEGVVPPLQAGRPELQGPSERRVRDS